MSQRRKPGDLVRRKAGSGFLANSEPTLVRIPVDADPEEETGPCLLGCGDPECQEWANLEVIEDGYAPVRDPYLYHISECQMEDVPN